MSDYYLCSLTGAVNNDLNVDEPNLPHTACVLKERAAVKKANMNSQIMSPLECVNLFFGNIILTNPKDYYSHHCLGNGIDFCQELLLLGNVLHFSVLVT